MLGVQAVFPGHFHQGGRGQVLGFPQPSVIGLELAHLIGAFGGRGRGAGELVHAGGHFGIAIRVQGEIFVDDFDPALVFHEQFVHYPVHAAAGRALEVAELDDGDRRGEVTEHGIVGEVDMAGARRAGSRPFSRDGKAPRP